MHPLLRDILAVLGGDHDRCCLDRFAVFVEQRDLTLGVGSEFGHCPRVPGLGHVFQNAVGIIERRRHIIFGFGAAIAEHDALIAGALVLRARSVDALRDVTGLLMHVAMHVQVAPMKAGLLVTDMLYAFTRSVFHHFVCYRLRTAHLAGQDDPVGRCKRFDRNAGIRIRTKI